MRCLLDTHALVWWLFDPPRLSRRAHDAIADPENVILVSAVSAFEVTNKYRIGKWEGIAPLALAFDKIIADLDFDIISIEARHASFAGLLAGEHRDPFDRLLAAQSQMEDVPIITVDEQIRTLGIETVW
jgi:PIN domain nuclease of toxin-antitoxin system